MKVSDLKKLLESYPDDMVVLNRRYSDYCIVEPSDFSVVRGVDQGGYVMQSHPTMSDENKAREAQYLLLTGN